MKTILFTMLSLIFLTSCAQETVKGNGKMTTEIREVAKNFNAVESAGSFEVTIKDGAQDGKIKLEGESNILDKIEVKVERGTLILKQKPGFNFRTNKKVTITFNAKNLKGVGLSGSGNITTEGMHKVESFKAGLSGSGDLDLKVSASDVNAGISGSGNIQLSGSTRKLTIGISGSGDVKAFDLNTTDVEIGVSGSGDVEVKVSGSLKASIAGSGDVYYKGQPDKVNVKAGGSGDVIDAN